MKVVMSKLELWSQLKKVGIAVHSFAPLSLLNRAVVKNAPKKRTFFTTALFNSERGANEWTGIPTFFKLGPKLQLTHTSNTFHLKIRSWFTYRLQSLAILAVKWPFDQQP